MIRKAKYNYKYGELVYLCKKIEELKPKPLLNLLKLNKLHKLYKLKCSMQPSRLSVYDTGLLAVPCLHNVLNPDCIHYNLCIICC